jgi:hypothetical protein
LPRASERSDASHANGARRRSGARESVWGSPRKLAALFQIEKNTVAVRLHRIRLRLQAELDR